MELADPLLDKKLRLGRFGGDWEVNLWHASHEIGLLPRTFVKHLAVMRVSG
jgi:hypothetical protein